jgi:transposase
VDRRKKGCKRHIISDAAGIPLIVVTTPANRRDEVPLVAMLDSLPPVKMPSGQLRYLPNEIVGDRGYGFAWTIADVVQRRIKSLLAVRGSPHGSGLGQVRYVIERTMSWISNYRRIDRCHEATGKSWQAMNELACCLICAKRLRSLKCQKMAA